MSGPTGSERRDEPSLLLPCVVASAQTFILINHAPLLPLVMRDLGITPAQAGLLSTVTFLGGGLLAIPIGQLTDWLGAKWMTAGSLAILLISTLGMAAAPGYGSLLAIRLLSGVGVCASFIAAGHYANAHWSGPRSALAQGLLGGSMQLGIGAAIFVLPFIATHVGWRGALALCAVPLVMALGLWLRWARATSPRRGTVSVRSIFADAASWRLGLVNGATFGLTVVLGTWVAVYFVEEFGLALTLAGMFGAQTALLGIIKELKTNADLTVDLEGFTDPTGPREYNYGLSQRRVESVRRYLIENGAELGRIYSIGMGPLNGGAAEHANLRRVTVRLMVNPTD